MLSIWTSISDPRPPGEREASVRRNALVVHHCSDDDLGYKSNSKSIIILIIVFISCAFTSKLYLINIKMCTNYLNINQIFFYILFRLGQEYSTLGGSRGMTHIGPFFLGGQGSIFTNQSKKNLFFALI